MAQILAGKDQWFVVHVLSGQENKVRENILKRVKTEEMGDMIYDVLVPTERVAEIKKGKKSETTRTKWTMARYKIRPASSKKSTPNEANCACPSPFSVAPLLWNWNTGRSSA